MDPLYIALFLIILGILLVLAEAFSPGIYMIVPGTVLLVIGLIGLVYPDFMTSWMLPVVTLIIALPATAGTIYAYKLLGKPELPSTTVVDSLVGKTGTVTVAVSPDDIRGKVRIGHDLWSARADEDIEVDEKVVVVSASGVHVRVRRI